MPLSQGLMDGDGVIITMVVREVSVGPFTITVPWKICNLGT